MILHLLLCLPLLLFLLLLLPLLLLQMLLLLLLLLTVWLAEHQDFSFRVRGRTGLECVGRPPEFPLWS
jgi:hypothetical protein